MKISGRFASLILIVVLLISLCGCKVSVPPPVDISSADEAVAMGFASGSYQSEIEVGKYAFFNVIIKVDYEYEVKWSSSDPKIATVDDNGRVDGISPGKVTIFAKAKKAQVSYDVTVKKAKSQPLSMTTAITKNQNTVDQNLGGENVVNPYAILINLKTGCATAYTYNSYGVYSIGVRAMKCSVGKGESTTEGSFKIDSHERWASDSNGRYYQYVTSIGDITLSSTPYSQMGSAYLLTDEYNKLGTQSTDGNIYFSVADAKWIYENCNLKTLVKITSTDGRDPLGVPVAMKLTENSKALKWDPTDDNKANPYNKLAPTFKGLEEVNVELGGTFDAYEGVTVYDTCGNKQSNGITVEGSVPCNKEGRYIITYIYTDAMKRTASANRVVNVVSE